MDRLLGEKGIPNDTLAGRREFSRQKEIRALAESSADYAQLRRG